MVDLLPAGEPGARRPRPIYRDFTLLQSAVLVFLVDQLTKYVVIQTLAPGMSFPFRGFFRFTHVHNTGSAFGIFQGFNTPLILVSFVGIVVLALIYRSQARPSNLLRLSLALQLGGAFGNLIDRVRLGFVTDFIDIGLWPVFNIADAAIVSGLFILGWVFTRGPTATEKTAEEGAGASSSGNELSGGDVDTVEDGGPEPASAGEGDAPPEPFPRDDEGGPTAGVLGPGRTGVE